MMTRDLDESAAEQGSWLGLEESAQPQPRPDFARGAGAHVTPAAALLKPTGLGMDPTEPGTYSRPYNPSLGMFGRLHQDQAAARKAASR